MIKIWEKPKEKPREVLVRLVPGRDIGQVGNAPHLILVDEEGRLIEGGILAVLTEQGALLLCGSVDAKLAEEAGILLDDDDSIVTEKE